MDKKLQVLAVAAVIGCITIVGAQQVVEGATSPGNRQGSAHGAGGAAASLMPEGYDNHFTVLLSQYFCRIQELELERAKRNGRQDLVQPIIKVCNSGILTLLRPEAQKRRIASLEIEKYAPHDRAWDEVLKTPTLVKHLLEVSPEADRTAWEAITIIWAPITKDTEEFMAYLNSLPEYRNAATKYEKNEIMYREDQKRRAASPPRDKLSSILDSMKLYDKALAYARAALTKPQQAEFDMLIQRYRAQMNAAAAPRP
jgi:hypothetical protein